jgi:hypothetical protein
MLFQILRRDRIIGSRFVPVIVLRPARLFRLAACVPVILTAASCSSIHVPTADDLIPQSPKFELKTLPTAPVRRLGTPVLINPDGSCPAASAEPEFSGTGIALQMSECDVVQRIGPPQNIDISADARGRRLAVMSYGGDYAGTYRFVSGRLHSMERAAGAPAPEPPAKKKAARKAAKRSGGSSPN